MSVPRFPRAVNTIGIAHAGLNTFNEGMPYVKASIVSAIQIDDFYWLQIVWFGENKQLNACCAAAVKRKINPIGLNSASKGMRGAYVSTKVSPLRLEWIAL